MSCMRGWRTSLAVFCAAAGLGIGVLTLAWGQAPAGGTGPEDAGWPAPRGGQVHTALGIPRTLDLKVGPGEPGVSAQFVIGTDDRVRITPTDTFPASAIAWLGLYDASGYVGHCTGTFVGPDVVLTAAHCLYDPATGWMEDIAVVPGRDGIIAPFGLRFASNWWVPDGWIISGGRPEWDWGLVALGPGMAERGWFRVGLFSTATLSRPSFFPAILGYPGDAWPPYTMWGAMTTAFAAVEPYRLYYDIDAFFGVSGAAIISLEQGTGHYGSVVGVHTHGGLYLNSGTRIDLQFLIDLLDGCEWMGCSLAWHIEEPAPSPTPTPSPTRTPTRTPTPVPTPTPLPTATATATPTPPRTATPPPPRPFRLHLPVIARE